MKGMEIFLKRGKINWLVREDCLIAFDRIQATCYSAYWSNSDNLFFAMRRKLLNSKESEYGDWIEAVSLAIKYKVKGQGTRIPTIDKAIKVG